LNALIANSRSNSTETRRRRRAADFAYPLNIRPVPFSGSYMGACFRAMQAALVRATGKSPGAIREADADCDRAMEILKKAVAAGFGNLPQMQTDPDLDALRNRDDFKQLIAQLKANKGKTNP
jgi:hypothetical protein